MINIGTGRETSINEIARVITGIIGSELKPVYAKVRPGDVRRHRAEVSKAKKLLGFEPKYSLEQGMKETVEWYAQKHDLNW